MKESELVDDLVGLFDRFPHLWQENDEHFRCKVLSIPLDGSNSSVFELHIYFGDWGLDDFILTSPITYRFGLLAKIRLRLAVSRWSSGIKRGKVSKGIIWVCEQEMLRNSETLSDYE